MRGRRPPLAVGALVAANALVFAYELVLVWSGEPDGEALSHFVETWGLVPRDLLRGTGRTGSWIWLTPATAMFLHGGLLHLAGNLLYLWVFGRAIEDLLGPVRFAAFYLACGLVAGAFQVASDPASFAPTIGASGAVAGVLGAYVVSYPLGRLRLLWPRVRMPAVVFLGLWIAIQVLSGVESWGREDPRVAWWAHVGGFAAGAALARAMWVRRPTHSRLGI